MRLILEVEQIEMNILELQEGLNKLLKAGNVKEEHSEQTIKIVNNFSWQKHHR